MTKFENSLGSLLCNRTHPYSVTLLTIAAGYFQAKPPVGYPNYSQI